MDEDLIKCPDCSREIPRTSIKKHIFECMKYTPSFYNYAISVSKHLNNNYLQFMMAELDLASEQLKLKNKMKRSNQQSKIQIRNSTKQKQSNYNEQHIIKQPIQENHPTTKKLQTTKKDDRFDRILNRIGKSSQPKERQNQDERHKKQTEDKQNQQKKIINHNVKKQIQNDQFAATIQIDQSYGQPKYFQQTDILKCENCQRKINANDLSKIIYADQCLHLYCVDCIKSYIRAQYTKRQGLLPCLIKQCDKKIPPHQIKQIVGQQQFEKYQKEMLRKTMNLAKCQKCKDEFEFMAGKSKDAPKKNDKGMIVKPTHAQHFAQNRFLCPKCKQDQCKNCKTIPYHLGYTCQQWKQDKNAKKCRYCQQNLKPGHTSAIGIKAFDDICNNRQCAQKIKKACSKIHSCGHACYGVINEKKCMPCLKQQCANKRKSQLHDQNQDSYCSICYITGLKTSPCVMSKCGHIFHTDCLQKRLRIRWLTPRIIFSFCQCPLCKQYIELNPQNSLTTLVNKYHQLRRQIQGKALQRLKYEKNDKDQKLKDPKSQYYQKPAKYAMAIYAYFQCFQCKKPYFGGKKNCAEVMNDRENQSDFDPKELVCPKCCPIEISNCPKHGKQFIEFKCKFCCQVSQWFCWGNTHFCDKCHKKQCSGQYVSKLPKDKLPKCEGPGKCPIGGSHGGNGQQRSIGCALCRDQKLNAHEF